MRRFLAFDDTSMIATWLHQAGYRMGLFGKYLNGYPDRYVPPGWDRWFATSFASLSGTAPLVASSGQTHRHRLNRRGTAS
jgi:hypothetical protein